MTYEYEMPLEDFQFQNYRLFEFKKPINTNVEMENLILEFIPKFNLLLNEGKIVGYHFLRHLELDFRLYVINDSTTEINQRLEVELSPLPDLESVDISVNGGSIGGYIHYESLYYTSVLTYKNIKYRRFLENNYNRDDKEEKLKRWNQFLLYSLHYHCNQNNDHHRHTQKFQLLHQKNNLTFYR